MDAHNKTFNLKKQTIIFVIHVVAVFTGFSYSLVIDKDFEIIVELGKMQYALIQYLIKTERHNNNGKLSIFCLIFLREKNYVIPYVKITQEMT